MACEHVSCTLLWQHLSSIIDNATITITVDTVVATKLDTRQCELARNNKSDSLVVAYFFFASAGGDTFAKEVECGCGLWARQLHRSAARMVIEAVGSLGLWSEIWCSAVD